MSEFRRFVRLLSYFIAVTFLSACGGSHGGASGLPTVPNVPTGANALLRAPLAAGSDVVAINAGGGAAGSFAADGSYVAAGTWTYKTAAAIATTGITNPAPQAVYQDEREGSTIAYTIGGLTAGTTYTVNLSFAELWWTSAGQRTFNVSINSTRVLTNFDIFATAGARYKAVVKSFSAVAGSTGTISIGLSGVINNAAISAIEVATGSGTGPTPPPGSAVLINSGGAASGSFLADTDFTAAGTWTNATTTTIDTSGVTNPAPQDVYKTARNGSTISYSIPGLTAGATYTVRLDFAETFWTTAGQRVFNVAINNAQVLSNFDVFAAAGARNKAVARSFSATASGSGAISIVFSAVTNNAIVSGIEVTSGGAPPSPTPPPTSTLVDWPTYGYDTQRTGYNPYTGDVTPASISKIHLGWQTAINGSTQTQPIVVTNVGAYKALLVIANFAVAQAYDATTGKRVWSTTLPVQDVQDCGIAGISGTAQYVKSLNAVFMAAGSGSGSPNHVVLYRLDVSSGKVTGQVDVTPTLVAGEANYSHSGLTFANGRIYLGTGSDCEGTPSGRYPSWRGRVVSVDPSSMTLLSTFFTSYGHGGNFGGGGVWSWGGVSADPSGNIYVATGNAETDAATSPQFAQAPFTRTTNEQAGYSEHLVKLSPDLSTVEGSNYPGFNFAIGYDDLDYSGTPVIYQPPLASGCGTLSATQGKGGTLVINNSQSLGVNASYRFSIPSGRALYIGNPAYSPRTGYLYAPITSSGNGSSLTPPGLAAIGGCGSSLAWHAQFGPDSALYSGENPRSAPTVTAGGVVFAGTPCTSNGSGGCGGPGAVNGAVWAVDAASGSVLGGGKPVLITGDNIRMAPSVDGSWIFVLDGSGNLYGLTVDPAVAAVTPQAGRRVIQSLRVRAK